MLGSSLPICGKTYSYSGHESAHQLAELTTPQLLPKECSKSHNRLLEMLPSLQFYMVS